MTSPNLSLAAKASWNATAVLIGSLGRLLAGLVVARQLGPNLNGQYAFLLWLTESLVLVFGVGLPNALNRFQALRIGQGDEVNAQHIIRFSLHAGFILGLFASLVAYSLCLHSLPAGTAAKQIAVALALLVAAQLWVGLAQSILTGLQYFRTYARATVFSSLALVIGQIVGVIGWGLNGAIYGSLVSYLASIVIFLRPVMQTNLWRKRLTASESTLGHPIAAYALDAWFSGLISAVVWGRAELFFLDRFSNVREVGFFSAGLVFSSVVVQIVNLISGALLPHFSYLVGRAELACLHNHYRRLTVFIALLAFPLSLGGVALMPEIVKLVFGASYSAATPAAQWLMATGLLSFSTVASTIVYSYGDAHIIRNWSILGAVLMVLLCTLLAPAAGAAGVSAARFIVQALLIGIGFYLLRKRYDLPLPFRPLLLLLISAICCAVAAGLVLLLAGGGLVGILLSVVFGSTFYLLMLRRLCVVSDEDTGTIRRFFRRLHPSFGKYASILISFIGSR